MAAETVNQDSEKFNAVIDGFRNKILANWEYKDLQLGNGYKDEAKHSLDEAKRIFEKMVARLLVLEEQMDKSLFERDDRKVPPYLNSYFVIPIAIAVILVVIVCAVSYAYLEREEKKVALMHAGLITPSASKNFQYISNGSSPTRGQNVVFEESSLTLRYGDYSDRNKLLLARPPPQALQQHQQQQLQQQQHQNSNVLWAAKQGPIAEETEEYPSPYGTLPIHQNGQKHSPPPLPPPNLPAPILKTFSEQPSNQLIQPSSSPSNQAHNQNLFNANLQNSQKQAKGIPFNTTQDNPVQINQQQPQNLPDSSQQSSVFCKADVHYDDSSMPAYDFFTFHRV